MTKPIVVVKCGDHLVKQWVDNLTPLLPQFQVVGYNADYEPKAVRYIVGWRPDARWINEFPCIAAVASIGSGVDHIEHLQELRHEIPVLRTVSNDLIQRMREFVTLCVLSWHRQLPQMLVDSQTHRWERRAVSTAQDVAVGILGYGRMGAAAAASLAALGYDVAVWAQSDRPDLKLPYFRGEKGLLELAKRSQIIVCMLPLTPQTENILNERLFAAMRRGGCLVNVGRGGHLADPDLLYALDTGTLSAAYLDAFRVEPLPESSELWQRQDIIITGHSAAYISPEAGPKVVARNLIAFEDGRTITPVYDPARGY